VTSHCHSLLHVTLSPHSCIELRLQTSKHCPVDMPYRQTGAVGSCGSAKQLLGQCRSVYMCEGKQSGCVQQGKPLLR
jgi:hypothetical protein